MQSATRLTVAHDGSSLEIRVCGPDCPPLSEADLRRMFPAGALTQSRLDRLREWPRVTVWCADRVVGVATCQKSETELRVAEVGLQVECGCSAHAVLNALIDALELAGLAGGCQRVVLMPPKASLAVLERRGYAAIRERCAGGWLEKTLL